jgi:hypothetical protein
MGGAHLDFISTKENVCFEVVQGFIYDVLFGGLTGKNRGRTSELCLKRQNCCVSY